MKHLPFAVAIVAIVILAGMLAVSAAESTAPRTITDVQAACLTEYFRICSAVPLVEAEVRACIKDHKSSFTPHCLTLAKEIK